MQENLTNKQMEAIVVSERRLAFLLLLNDRLRPLADPVEIQFQAASVLGEYLGADRVGYAEDLGDGEHVRVTRNYLKGVPGIEGIYVYNDYGPELLAWLRDGKTVIRDDVAAATDLTASEKAAHEMLQLGATLNTPLLRGCLNFSS